MLDTGNNAAKTSLKNKRIVFYDGECGFCSKSVQFILKKQQKEIYFMPLQSKNAETIIATHQKSIDMNTLFYYDGKKLYEKSTAVLQIAKNLHFGYRFLARLGYVIPKFLRDKLYDTVAKRRLQLAGEYCYLPDADQRKLFLD